ncbi:M16 family metallopeptidase [Flavobacterium sedimenticola]|uniref:Pitrilysin family protein n=1 Tax=Flavobacterium sedimenticola TaxID=3043286 RepID=A0ABT6XLA4_9FLAO|nr:pitrilysin family protein [Flavobacterium sedimenticola]MDI9255871.1 pitrilysin family protein [Flavobacterium sedimenticola]
MKKTFILLSSLFLTLIMQAQDRTQPKPGPAPSINIKKPETFSLPNGLKVLVVENHKLPRVSYSLTIDNTPYAEGDKKGVDELTSALIGNGSLKTPKDAFNEEIDFLGANINFYSSGASASGLSKHAKRILELMAEGALTPNFTQEEFDKERDKLIEGLKTQEKSVTAVAGRVEKVLAYGKSHPAGEYLSEETIKNVSLADVKANYRTYFVPEHAYLVIVGDVKTKDVKKNVEKLFGSWVKATAPRLTYSNPTNVQYTQINFVDMPNAVQSEITLFNTVNLKMSDPDFFPVILANQVFGGDFNSYLNMNLREKHGWTYGARSSVGFDKNMHSEFRANTQVRNAVTDSAITQALYELNRIRTEKVTEETLNNVKAGYIGRFVMQVEKPATVARYALNIETEGLPANFYENYIKNINAVTPDDIMRVVNRYFLADNMRILVVGKASDVLPGLESLKIPIFYFDKFGNPTEKPAMKKPVPAGVSVKTVIDAYVAAIGGDKAIKSVKSIASVGETKIPQAPMPLSYTSKIDAKGRMMVELSMAGMGSLMKQVVNGNSGYMMQQGQKKVLEGDDLAKMKESAVLFNETLLANKPGVTVTGIEPMNGSDAYTVVDGDTTYYFDVKSGLKTAEATTDEQGGQKVTRVTYFNDYRAVKGVKVPFNTVMNVGFELDIKMSDVKINEGVIDADFQ